MVSIKILRVGRRIVWGTYNVIGLIFSLEMRRLRDFLNVVYIFI